MQLNEMYPLEVSEWISGRLFDVTPASIFIVDETLSIISANSAFRAIFGDPSGKNCYQVYKKQQKRCEECAALKTLKDGRSRITAESAVDCVAFNADFVVYHVPVSNGGGKVRYVANISHDVSDRKTIQNQYNVLFDRAPCSLSIINKDYRIVSANERARSIYGDVIGSYCYSTYKKSERRCSRCPAAETFADGLPHSSSEMRVADNGSSTYHVVSTAPIDYGERQTRHVIEMSLDVTDVRVLSEQLMRESIFRQKMTENALDAIVSTDRDGVVTIFNEAAEMLYGYRRSDVVGRMKAERFFPGPFCQVLSQKDASLMLNETNVVNAKGEAIPVRFSGTVLSGDDDVIGSAAYIQDLREIQALERKRIENERLAAIGETASQVAHSIKNILTGLQGGLYSTRTAYETNSRERALEGIQTLDRNLRRIRGLVIDFLRFSKEYPAQFQLVDPNSVAQEIFDLYSQAAEQKRIRLVFEPNPALGRARLDPGGIHTCLANLVSNAFDACEAAPSSKHLVEIRVRKEKRSIVFEVQDDGCGMKRDQLDRLFSEVFSTKGNRGSGLGLLITQKIVQDHGGSIKIASKPGEGSKIALALPSNGNIEHTGVTKTTGKNTETARKKTGEVNMSKQILVIDDEPDVNGYLTRLLTDNGYAVDSAFNVDEAMKIIADKHIDLMLLDLQMPGKTGTDLYRRLRSKKDIKTIVVSGVAGRNLAVGKDVVVLGKPIDEDNLLDEVRKQIGEA